MDVASIFIPVTKCQLSTPKQEECKGIRAASWIFYTFPQRSLNNKLVFTQELCCFSTCVVLSCGGWIQRAVECRAANSVYSGFWVQVHNRTQGKEIRGRGGFWPWHKQEAIFVFPPAQWGTHKFYSKCCPCAIYFVGLSNKICSARNLHNTHSWKISHWSYFFIFTPSEWEVWGTTPVEVQEMLLEVEWWKESPSLLCSHIRDSCLPLAIDQTSPF